MGNIFLLKKLCYRQKRFDLKHFFLFSILFCVALAFSQETLPVYKKVKGKINEDAPVGELNRSDWIKELPIPQVKVKKVSWVKETVQVKDKKGKVVKDKKGNPKTKVKKKKVVKYVMEDPKEPPKFVPIDCKIGQVYAKRSELARFQQESLDLSGEYASATGSLFLKKSPNNPGKFTVTIQNGPLGDRAEIEMSDIVMEETGNKGRLSYKEEGCSLDISIVNRKVTVMQRGCTDYNSGNYKLEGEYSTYKGNTRRVDTFVMPEKTLKFKKYFWCGSGFDSCEKVKDDNGTVYITWSKDGKGFIERKAGEDVHVYRPFEHMIPRKRDFYKGEKPVVIKTKRTDMAGEWMIWYFYPKAERLKMVRAGMNEETAYMEIYE